MIDVSSPDAWKRPFANAKKLFFGRAAAAILSLGYIALTTRSLGVTDFGALTLIHATVLLVGNLVTFQSSKMIMRYGAQALQSGNPRLFLQYVNFGIKLEFLAATVGLSIIWILKEPLIGLFGLSDVHTSIFSFYSLLLIIILLSKPAGGCLSLLDRHDLISWHLVATPLLRFLGAAFLFIMDGTLLSYLILWFGAATVSKGILLYLAWHTVRKHIKAVKSQKARPHNIVSGRYGAPERGVWSYVWGTNANASIGVDIAPMLVAGGLGPSGAGVWRVAQKMGSFVAFPVSKLLSPAIHTDMTWLNAQSDQDNRRSIVIKTGAITGVASLMTVTLVIIFGHDLIRLIAGPGFEDAYGAMVMVGLAAVLGAFSFGLAPMLVTAGKIWHLNAIKLFNLAVFVTITPSLMNWLGITGVGVAAFVQAALNLILLTLASLELLRNKNTKTAGYLS